MRNLPIRRRAKRIKLVLPVPLEMSQLGDELCNYCLWTLEGTKVNSGPHNLCEGSGCESAYGLYLDLF